MKLSQIAFRISFLVFAIVYFAVIAEFLAPHQFELKIDLNIDAVFVTSIVLAYFYVFLRKAKF